MAQRLIRRDLSRVQARSIPSPNRFILKMIWASPTRTWLGHHVYRGAGCKRCSGIGFRGRQGIFEMLSMNNELRELAFNRAPTNHVRRAALAGGMRPLLEDGKLKILRGITTPDEIARITQAEGHRGRRRGLVTLFSSGRRHAREVRRSSGYRSY